MDHPIFTAIFNNELYKVIKLLSHIDDIHKIRKNYMGILEYAYRHRRNHSVFQYLMENIDINYPDPKYGPMFLEILNMDCIYYEDVPYILSFVKNINAKHFSKTILYLFTIRTKRITKTGSVENNIKIIELLIEHGANPFERSGRDQAIFYNISQYPHPYNIESLKILLNTKSNNIEIDRHITARTIREIVCSASEIIGAYDMIEMMLPYVEDINEFDAEGNVLWHAKTYASNEIDIIELLEMNGARL